MFIKSDGFRFISHLHTTSRQLFICSEIVKEIGNGQLPKEIIQRNTFQWSSNEEKINPSYRESRGKLTENGTKTTAFNHYLDLCEAIGLIISFNEIYSNSKLGHILLSCISLENNERTRVSETEVIFYLIQLLRIDADGLLLVLSLIDELSKVNQRTLQEKFKETLNNRLLAKQAESSSTVRLLINEKFRTVNYVWQNTEKYAEHLMVPRCEWLVTIGILKQKRDKSSTYYSFTEFGKFFFNNIPNLSERLKDINEEWINDMFFSIFNKLNDGTQRTEFKYLTKNNKQEILGEYLGISFNTIKTSNSFRYPVYESLLFTCLNMYKNDIVINFQEIIEALEIGINYNNRNYSMKNTGRMNESYIITRLT